MRRAAGHRAEPGVNYRGDRCGLAPVRARRSAMPPPRHPVALRTRAVSYATSVPRPFEAYHILGRRPALCITAKLAASVRVGSQPERLTASKSRPDTAQIPAQRLRPLHLTYRNVEGSLLERRDHAFGSCSARAHDSLEAILASAGVDVGRSAGRRLRRLIEWPRPIRREKTDHGFLHHLGRQSRRPSGAGALRFSWPRLISLLHGRRFLKLVSSGYRAGLSPSGTDIDIYRAETGVRKVPNGARIVRKSRPRDSARST